MYDNLEHETPRETLVSIAYNIDSGMICELDRETRRDLDAKCRMAKRYSVNGVSVLRKRNN